MTARMHTEETQFHILHETPAILDVLDAVRREIVRIQALGYVVRKIEVSMMILERHDPPPVFDWSYPVLIVASRNLEHADET